MDIKGKLMMAGVGEAEVLPEIFRHVYTRPQQVWWHLRKWLRFDPYTADWDFVLDLSRAQSHADVGHAFRDYHFRFAEQKACLMKPNRKRVINYFEQVMFS
ncbi:MAG: hypothetical protein K9M98_10295 [Cephaloticoccus sp.]|nr:hypothetical protein [Cephaloticoccus sp.]MCF7760883.1 hypothetical protein [Cephaloticoccus sp.]